MVLLMNPADIARLGLREGAIVTATTAVDDAMLREVSGLRVTPFDIPAGCIAGYFPECNPLVPLAHHAEGSKVPASKSNPGAPADERDQGNGLIRLFQPSKQAPR